MTESNFFEVNTRALTPATFTGGDLDFNFYASDSDAWYPSKSYIRVGLTLLGSGAAQPTASQMIALADNAVGNLFANASLYAGQNEISACRIGLAQASALVARTKSDPWLKSIARGAYLNEPKFSKRVMNIASGSPPDSYLGAINEMYKPVTAGAFNTSTISITAAATGAINFPLTNLVAAGTALTGIAPNQTWGPVNIPLTNLAAAAGTGGGVVTGFSTLFTSGMPNSITGAPSGSTIAVGDILVAYGMQFPISGVTNDLTLQILNAPATAILATSDWYILRKDVIRAPQADNIVYAIWKPPIGIFDYEGALGGGQYKLSLSPNTNYSLAAVETKNGAAVVGTDYTLQVSSVKLFTYVEKMRIPDQIQELPLMEYQVLAKAWQPTVQFSVSPDTEAITIFIQDRFAGINTLVPPSMFKTIDNSDLQLQKIQVSFAGINKPSTQWDSFFGNGTNRMQQRYNDSYRELGLDVNGVGCELYEEYLQRGAFYHYNFLRDVNSHATSVSVSTTFNGLGNGPMSNFPNDGSALIYCIAHYRATSRVTIAGGRVVSASTLRG